MMVRPAGAGFFLLFFFLVLPGPQKAFAVNPDDIIRLKEAGAGDRVIREIIRSRAVSRGLVSIREVVEMKAAGIGDGIIVTLLRYGSATGPELDREDAADRALGRDIHRSEAVLLYRQKEIDLLVGFLTRLVSNPDVLKLVREGKISGDDYARIVKYLKQYARDEETLEYGDEGDINIDVRKTGE